MICPIDGRNVDMIPCRFQVGLLSPSDDGIVVWRGTGREGLERPMSLRIEERITALEARMTALERVPAHVERLTGEIVDLRTEVGELRTEVGDLRTKVVDLRTEVVDLRSEVGDLRTEMRAEFSAVRGEAAAGFVAVRREIASVEERLSTRIEDARRETRVLHENVIGRIVVMGEGFAANVSLSADTRAALETVSERLAAIESRLPASRRRKRSG